MMKANSSIRNQFLLVLLAIPLLAVPLYMAYLGFTTATQAGLVERYVLGFISSSNTSDFNRFTATSEALSESPGMLAIGTSQTKATQRTLHDRVMTTKVAELQARLLRLDALGQSVVLAAKLNPDEFDFSVPPPLGGPVDSSPLQPALSIADEIELLQEKVQIKESKMDALRGRLSSQRFNQQLIVSGRPTLSGWLSSPFGMRKDPFTGKPAWHNGIDFAGREGSDIVSVATGVVTWAGRRAGYGLMVELNHGNGYKTRYAHCKALTVEPGDMVDKGQVIASMGSTGRSTGPHVHFEVWKNGKAVNPYRYLKKTTAQANSAPSSDKTSANKTNQG